MKAVSIQPVSIDTEYELPMALARVEAGFPSPAEDYLEDSLDLNQHLIPHPASTFIVRVEGDSMIEENIRSGDMLIVDRSLTPARGNIVIAELDGEFTVKTLGESHGQLALIPANPDFEPIPIRENSAIWGVVTHSISCHLKL